MKKLVNIISQYSVISVAAKNFTRCFFETIVISYIFKSGLYLCAVGNVLVSTSGTVMSLQCTCRLSYCSLGTRKSIFKTCPF